MKLRDLLDKKTNRKSLKSSTLACCLVLLAAMLVSSATVASAEPYPAWARLPLGDHSLPESRTQKVLAPGVTLTSITRGAASADEYWTLRVYIPVSDKSSLALAPLEQAQQLAAALQEAGFPAVVQEERNPHYIGLPAGILGYSVRLGKYDNKDAVKPDQNALYTLGYMSSPIFTGEDNKMVTGPWEIRVLTIDPRHFRGDIFAWHGSSIAGKTKVTDYAKQTGALAVVNSGYYVVTTADGVPGDPAGLFISNGKVLSEATNGRVTMNIFGKNTPWGRTHIKFQELTTTISLIVDEGLSHPVEGINRKAGLIRNCGGTGDTPTNLPQHDITCTDADELVVLTPEFGATAPDGDGLEAVVDGNGMVTEVRNRTGGTVPADGMVVQGIGSEAAWLNEVVRVGTKLRLDIKVTDKHGRIVRFDSNDSATNGGPRLLVHGWYAIQPVADGLVHPDDPSFLWGWGVRRNPRTMAGVDRHGRLLLVTVDGRQPGYSLGLTLVEGSQLMAALGAVDAINLDGGGSTTMAINGELVTSPSDPTGERPVSDVIVVKER